MIDFGRLVATEKFVQASVSAAIGMEEQYDAVGAVQPDGFFDLRDKELPVGFVLRRRQRFGPARNNDRVGVDDPDSLQKFSQNAIEAMIETSHHNGIAVILLGRGIKVKYAFQTKLTLRSSHLPSEGTSFWTYLPDRQGCATRARKPTEN
jgi:hypothetical protein